MPTTVVGVDSAVVVGAREVLESSVVDGCWLASDVVPGVLPCVVPGVVGETIWFVVSGASVI